MTVCGLTSLTRDCRYLEQRVDGDRRLMRLAIQPKFARKSSDDFWREVQRLCLSAPKDRKVALQKWLPQRTQHPVASEAAANDRRDAIRRFSYIFDRNFAVKNSNAPKVARAAASAANAGNASEEPPLLVAKGGGGSKAQCKEEDAGDHMGASGLPHEAGAGAAEVVKDDAVAEGEKSSKKRQQKRKE